MKFIRNKKDFMVFIIMGCITLLVGVVCVSVLLLNVVTAEESVNYMKEISFLSIISSVVMFLCAFSLRKDFIEFTKNKIIIINGFPKFAKMIDLSEIKTILLPSNKALKNKIMANKIVFILNNGGCFYISREKEIVKYVLDNLMHLTNYYDKFSDILKTKTHK